MERVSVMTGKSPLIFLCPYGADNPATAKLTEEIVYYSEGSAVINRGFRKGFQVDYSQEIADLDRIDHCLSEPVVYDEFIRPVTKLKDKLKANHKRIYLFVLTDLKKPGPVNMDLLIGYGNGDQYTLSCPVWAKDLFSTALMHVELNPYEAASNGGYTGSDARCLNQLFRVYEYDKDVMSMHLWMNHHVLKNTRSNASGLADAAVELTKHTTFRTKPVHLPVY